ncbi:MAG: hypothetical protein IJ874_00205 [Ruminococcus sp.]|nr:hypothetical protein [Ruminococcus sp.]
MTATDMKNTQPEPVPVDAKKLIDAIGTIFGGVVQILSAAEPAIAKELADMALNGVSKDKAPENLNLADFEEIISADDLPWDTDDAPAEKAETPAEPPKQDAPVKTSAKTPAKTQPKAAKKKSEPTSTVTADDLTKIIVQKIKQNRANSDKIGALLKSYGVEKVSALPQDKYEAFLTDVAQL